MQKDKEVTLEEILNNPTLYIEYYELLLTLQQGNNVKTALAYGTNSHC